MSSCRPTRKALMDAPRCDRESFVAAVSGTLFSYKDGKLVVGDGKPTRLVEALEADTIKLVVLTVKDKPVSYVQTLKKEIKECAL